MLHVTYMYIIISFLLYTFADHGQCIPHCHPRNSSRVGDVLVQNQAIDEERVSPYFRLSLATESSLILALSRHTFSALSHATEGPAHSPIRKSLLPYGVYIHMCAFFGPHISINMLGPGHRRDGLPRLRGLRGSWPGTDSWNTDYTVFPT